LTLNCLRVTSWSRYTIYDSNEIGLISMKAVTIRNLPEATHRALRVRAAINGRSTEAEIRAILEDAVRPEGRVKIGSLLASIARRAGVKDEDVDALEQAFDKSPAEPLKFG
jgi:plasmid stability protein